MRSFLFGLSSGLIFLTAGLMIDSNHFILTAVGIIGIGSLLVSGLLTGAFIDGDRIRANFANENKQERSKRINISMNLFLFGLPNLIAGILLVIL
ncbi:DUF5316 domain-containing protein [Bacillus sp. 03113]|uniref:DUF5316 domain-containing protein n=1 Tax=Bacillus sp. 03113 TaxID=2578211 RepID=UPI001144DCB8|nr:DUF5316 domain-containing protein [Bacillus sp. 03113]